MSAVAEYSAILAQEAPEVAHKDEVYHRLLDRLSAFLVRENLNEAEEKVVDLITVLIHLYEKERFAANVEKTSGIEVLKHLMEVQGLKQADLVPSIFESPSVACETLKGDRDLTLKHIKRLSERFNLSLETFAN